MSVAFEYFHFQNLSLLMIILPTVFSTYENNTKEEILTLYYNMDSKCYEK